MNTLYCGIDIANDTAVYVLLGPVLEPLERAATFRNTPAGHRDALKWMRKLAKAYKPFELHAVMEATGVYYLSAARFFHKQTGVTVSVVNPAQV